MYHMYLPNMKFSDGEIYLCVTSPYIKELWQSWSIQVYLLLHLFLWLFLTYGPSITTSEVLQKLFYMMLNRIEKFKSSIQHLNTWNRDWNHWVENYKHDKPLGRTMTQGIAMDQTWHFHTYIPVRLLWYIVCFSWMNLCVWKRHVWSIAGYRVTIVTKEEFQDVSERTLCNVFSSKGI